MRFHPFPTYGRGMNRIFPLTLILAASLLAAAPAGAAPSKFKADLYIHQSSEWAVSWTTPEICGDDYRHFFRGDGTGSVTYKAKGVPVTFKRSRGGFWQTNEFALSGRLGRRAGYEVGQSGNPEGCLPDYVHLPEQPDTTQCGGKDVAKSSKSFWLMIVGGRIAPAGAFTGKDGGDPYDNACPDQSFKTAIVESIPSPQRRDVDKLIQNKNVRSIELASGKSYFGGPLTTNELGFPGGVNHAGEGEWEGRWTLKLTRVR